MIRRLLSLGAAALAGLVAGCGDGPSTVPGTLRSPATWSSFVYATSGGPLLLEVLGDPFGGGGQVRRAAAGAMSEALPERPFAMTLDPASAPHPRFRVILAFGAGGGQDARALCAGTLQGRVFQADGGRIDVLAAFCDGAELLSSVQGWVARAGDADDRRFRQLLGQMTRELMGSPP